MSKKLFTFLLAFTSMSHQVLGAKSAIINCPQAKEISIKDSPATAPGNWSGEFTFPTPNLSKTKASLGVGNEALVCTYSGPITTGKLTAPWPAGYTKCEVTPNKDGFNCS